MKDKTRDEKRQAIKTLAMMAMEHDSSLMVTDDLFLVLKIYVKLLESENESLNKILDMQTAKRTLDAFR